MFGREKLSDKKVVVGATETFQRFVSDPDEFFTPPQGQGTVLWRAFSHGAPSQGGVVIFSALISQNQRTYVRLTNGIQVITDPQPAAPWPTAPGTFGFNFRLIAQQWMTQTLHLMRTIEPGIAEFGPETLAAWKARMDVIRGYEDVVGPIVHE